MDDLDIWRIVVLWLWCFGLAGIEIELEGGYGWAERLPTWYYKRGWFGRVYGIFMGPRPIDGYHVFAFLTPLLLVHLPFVFGVEWTIEDELAVLGVYFLLSVFWDYLWFVLNPAYTVHRFKRGNVWWFEVPWIWRFPIDYYNGVGLSVILVGGASLIDGDPELLYRHLWTLAGLIVLTGAAVLAAPLYWRWYRHMRRPGADDRDKVHTYPPPAPNEVWSGGVPDLTPLEQKRR
jgi:hypothetical protein